MELMNVFWEAISDYSFVFFIVLGSIIAIWTYLRKPERNK